MESFAKRIKKARLANKLTQQQLSELMSITFENSNISRTAITQWETGHAKGIDGKNLIKLSKVLNVSPEWIIFGI